MCRYGSPNNVSKEYKEFAEWYLKTFSGPVIDVLIRILDRQRRKEYVSPQVLQSTLFYLNQAYVLPLAKIELVCEKCIWFTNDKFCRLTYFQLSQRSV